MKPDRITRIGRSLVQHGPLNDRVFLMSLDMDDYPGIIDALEDLARKNGYTKLFCKVPEPAGQGFIDRGYIKEARIPGFYREKTDALFVCKYLSRQRSVPTEPGLMAEVMSAAGAKAGGEVPDAPEGYEIRPLSEEHAEDAARVYNSVFATYPFPINDPGYIKDAMGNNVRYFGAFNGELAALSAAETDPHGLNAEMTDIATLPKHRAKGLAGVLLRCMEDSMRKAGIRTVYTIARACSYGMNIAFSRAGYRPGGTLVNNTNISGGLESMNVWYKRV